MRVREPTRMVMNDTVVRDLCLVVVILAVLRISVAFEGGDEASRSMSVNCELASGSSPPPEREGTSLGSWAASKGVFIVQRGESLE